MTKKIAIALVLLFTTVKSIAQESTASKQVSTFNIEATQLQTTKKIWIYLPKNYTSSKKTFPVIYMYDGQNLFDAKTADSVEWKVDEQLDSLKMQVIIVGIESKDDKNSKSIPYKIEKADNYLDFIVKTLKPQIDKNYRTKPSHQNTIIMGSAVGGLVSYYALLKYPEVFGKAGIFSPSFGLSKEVYDLTQKAEKMKSKIYFLCGDNESADMVPDVNKMDKLVSRTRCSCLNLTKKVIVKGGQHNEKLWSQGFAKAVLWLR